MSNIQTDSQQKSHRVVVVMPAYNVAPVVRKAIESLPPNIISEIYVIDDGSHDGTAEVAKAAGATVITHAKNRGYGGAQKSGYLAAIASNADAVVLVHGDNQYDPSYAPEFIRKILEEGCDIVAGTRMVLGDALKNNMPLWKYYPIRATTFIQKPDARNQHHRLPRRISRIQRRFPQIGSLGPTQQPFRLRLRHDDPRRRLSGKNRRSSPPHPLQR